MKEKHERLGARAAVKGTMVQAHLAWAAVRCHNLERAMDPWLSPQSRSLVAAGVLATDWFPFRCLVDLDRAIASAVGGIPDQVFRELGRYSASVNLGGAYRVFMVDEPHRVFERTALIHGRFQNFGVSTYQQTGPRAGRIRLADCEEYSPVFCASALGFYEGALVSLHAPGRCAETSCVCSGDPACMFEMEW